MDQVKIRASVSAHGLRKNQEVTVAATATIEGAILSGVFEELERIPDELEADLIEAITTPVDLPPDEPKARNRPRG